MESLWSRGWVAMSGTMVPFLNELLLCLTFLSDIRQFPCRTCPVSNGEQKKNKPTDVQFVWFMSLPVNGMTEMHYEWSQKEISRFFFFVVHVSRVFKSNFEGRLFNNNRRVHLHIGTSILIDRLVIIRDDRLRNVITPLPEFIINFNSWKITQHNVRMGLPRSMMSPNRNHATSWDN